MTPDRTCEAQPLKAHGTTLWKPATRRSAPFNANCVVCGVRNTSGLQLEFRNERHGVQATWVPTKSWEGFQGVVHGGIIGTVLDEAMSKAIVARNWEALTVDLRVRFRGRVTPGEELLIRGWVIDKQKRRIKAEATLTTSFGVERAHAWGTFLVPRT